MDRLTSSHGGKAFKTQERYGMSHHSTHASFSSASGRKGRIRTALAAAMAILSFGFISHEIGIWGGPTLPGPAPARPSLAEAYPEKLPEGPFMAPFAHNASHRVLLIGDRRVQDLMRMAKSVDAFGSAEVSAIHVPDECQPYFGRDDVSDQVPPEMLRLCRVVWANALKSPLVSQASTIIFASDWKPWFSGRFDELLDLTIQNSIAEILFLGPLRPVDRELADQAIDELGARFVIDITRSQCPRGEACEPKTSSGEPVFGQDSLLTTAGAAWLGPMLFLDSRLSRFLSDGA